MKTFRLAVILVACVPLPCLAQSWQHLAKVDRIERMPTGLVAHAGTSVIEVTAIAPSIARVRISFTGRFDSRPSWAVIKTPEAVKTSLREDTSSATLGLTS